MTEMIEPKVYRNQKFSQANSGTTDVGSLSLVGRFQEELKKPAKRGRMSPTMRSVDIVLLC